MGYDTDRFVSPVNDAFSCCICKDILEDPVQAPCEHAYCRACIENWFNRDTTCPVDRRYLTRSSLRKLYRYMRNDYNLLQIRCKNHAYGCQQVLALEFLNSHEKSCVYTRLECPNERCKFYAPKIKIDEHLRRCKYGQIECPHGCGFLIMRLRREQHNCIQELRTHLEVLHTENTCIYQDQKIEIEHGLSRLGYDMQQNNKTLQTQINSLKLENSQLRKKNSKLTENHSSLAETVKCFNKKVTTILVVMVLTMIILFFR